MKFISRIIYSLFNPWEFFQKESSLDVSGQGQLDIVWIYVKVLWLIATNRVRVLMLLVPGFVLWWFPDELIGWLGVELPWFLTPLLEPLKDSSSRGGLLMLYFLWIVPSVLMCLSSMTWLKKFSAIILAWFCAWFCMFIGAFLMPLLGPLSDPSILGGLLVLCFLWIVPSVLICLSSMPWLKKFSAIILVWFCAWFCMFIGAIVFSAIFA